MSKGSLAGVLERLRAHRAELEAMGVLHAAVFGSVARGEAGPDSDLDIVVELDPAKPLGVWGYVGVIHYMQDLFGNNVDVADKDGLKLRMPERVLREGVDAF